jgi:hypothetical protein
MTTVSILTAAGDSGNVGSRSSLRNHVLIATRDLGASRK